MAGKLTIRHEFPAVKKAAWETVQQAREVWLETAAEEAEKRAASQAATRGYALQIGIDKERLGFQSARIAAVTHTERWGDDPWFLRLFEYGTVYIQAMPFIRPGARKGNKAFLAIMGTQLEGKIKRRTRRVQRR
jgi:hypothetical protein